MKRLLTVVVAFVFAAFYSTATFAQCAMCRASVESNISEDGVNFAAKLNTGILYLFVMPYLIALVIGYFWWKKSREQRRFMEEAELRKRRIAGL
ncbi:MAG: hypothetical protein U5K79_05265 [Cyclobacteriaceae bacterium]|nr:hypothetical protein [Cyclobacteriaceae bacterium]